MASTADDVRTLIANIRKSINSPHTDNVDKSHLRRWMEELTEQLAHLEQTEKAA